MNELQQLDGQIATARRLEAMGLHIPSPELVERAKEIRTFGDSGGNRAMRRQAKRAMRQKGHR